VERPCQVRLEIGVAVGIDPERRHPGRGAERGEGGRQLRLGADLVGGPRSPPADEVHHGAQPRHRAGRKGEDAEAARRLTDAEDGARIDEGRPAQGGGGHLEGIGRRLPGAREVRIVAPAIAFAEPAAAAAEARPHDDGRRPAATCEFRRDRVEHLRTPARLAAEPPRQAVRNDRERERPVALRSDPQDLQPAPVGTGDLVSRADQIGRRHRRCRCRGQGGDR